MIASNSTAISPSDFFRQEGAVSAQTNNQANPSQATANKEELDTDEQREVQELKRQDTAVRAHEAAHIAAGGGIVRGGAQFQYENGPDGKRYAVAGEVSIDSSKVSGDPQATLTKAEQIQRAALAPADPSAQDRRVAAQAGRMAAEARMEIAKEGREGADTKTEAAETPAANPTQPYLDVANNSGEKSNLIDLMS